jgi:antitoxin component HigA of HigAB toxin-antitoxin module
MNSIQNSIDHSTALERLERLMLSEPLPGSLAEEDLVNLAKEIERYEKDHVSISHPTAEELRQFKEE